MASRIKFRGSNYHIPWSMHPLSRSLCVFWGPSKGISFLPCFYTTQLFIHSFNKYLDIYLLWTGRCARYQGYSWECEVHDHCLQEVYGTVTGSDFICSFTTTGYVGAFMKYDSHTVFPSFLSIPFGCVH